MTIDPVTAPSEYQRMLLALLGEDDPAEVQAAAPARLRRLVDTAADRLREPPAANEWSVIELVGHIVDAEVVLSGRYRWILAHDEPAIMPYDQDLWADRLRHRDADPEELLALFEPLRAANLALWARSSPGERARIGHHAERGPESYELTFRLLAGHDRFHLDQADRTLAALVGALAAESS